MVTVSATDGDISALPVTGIKIDGAGSQWTFTGTVSALNQYFTTSGNLAYTYTSTEESRTLTVRLTQAGFTSEAQAILSPAVAVPVTDAPASWSDLSVQGQVMAAAGAAQSANSSGLHLSIDGGASWRAVAVANGLAIERVSVSPNGKTIAALTASGSAVLSRDGGVTWSTFSLPATSYRDVLAMDDGSVFAGQAPTQSSQRQQTASGAWTTVTTNVPGLLLELNPSETVWQVRQGTAPRPNPSAN